MNDQLLYVSGDFEGYFYTHQKMPMGELEKLPGGQTHDVHIYRGDIQKVKQLSAYKPEEHLNRDGLLLHNVTNIQVGEPGDKNKRLYDFDQIVLKNVEVQQSWELNGKTYGILKGYLVGKVKQSSASGADRSTPIIPPAAIKEPEKKWWQPHPSTTRVVDPAPTEGGARSGRRGCFTSIWDILKWLLLILLLLFLYKACLKGKGDQACAQKLDEMQIKYDSLKLRFDSLENQIRFKDSSLKAEEEENRIQEAINSVTDKIYFYGNSDEIREYSENSLKDLINILNKYPRLNLEIQGHTNGTNILYRGLDLRRAEKVKQLLIENGISTGRLNTVGMGDRYPVVEKDSREKDPWGNEYNANMRVEIIIRK